MSEVDSTTPAPSDKSSASGPGLQPLTTASGKPAKPYPDFPLGPHPAGYWCKKIRGTVHYFGPHWNAKDHAAAAGAADAALAEYLEKKDDLHAGRTPRPDVGDITVKDVCNAFLNHKLDKLNAAELSVRTFGKYKEVAALILKQLGKSRLVVDLRPDDFTALKNWMSSCWGPLRVGDFIQHVRSVFKHAFDSDLLDRPMRFGPGFSRPSHKTKRLHKAKQGKKLFTADEVRRLIDAAGTQLKGMLLLGINCGFGNTDVAGLPLSALDLEKGWVSYPRPKTGIDRRCPLWPETVAALREVLVSRPQAKREEDGKLIFLSERGTPCISVRSPDPEDSKTVNRTDGLAVQMAKLLKKLDINGRKGIGFYTLRHTFRTIADEAKDQPAADYIMGHESPHMSTVYRERISDERLRVVVNHVREWLFGAAVQ